MPRLSELRPGHYDFMERIDRYGSLRTSDFNEKVMTTTTLSHHGLVTYEKLGTRTLEIRLTDAGRAAMINRTKVSVQEGGNTLPPNYGKQSTGCRRHLPKRTGWPD